MEEKSEMKRRNHGKGVPCARDERRREEVINEKRKSDRSKEKMRENEKGTKTRKEKKIKREKRREKKEGR